jgi:hypothetical protein
MWQALAVTAAFCPIASWALLARTRLIGAIVAAVLAPAALLALALALDWVHPGHWAGLVLSYVPITALVVCVGVLLERRRLASRPGELISWRRATGWLLLAVFVVGAGVLPLPLVALGSIAHHDHPRVLPLPADLVAEQTSHGCGSSSCTREFTITSATHDSTDHMVAELRRFLTTSRGWSLDEHGSGCQQTGWLNADQLCVDIAADHDHVQLSIQESGPWT